MTSYDLLQAAIVGLVAGCLLGCWLGYWIGWRDGAQSAADEIQAALDEDDLRIGRSLDRRP